MLSKFMCNPGSGFPVRDKVSATLWPCSAISLPGFILKQKGLNQGMRLCTNPPTSGPISLNSEGISEGPGSMHPSSLFLSDASEVPPLDRVPWFPRRLPHCLGAGHNPENFTLGLGERVDILHFQSAPGLQEVDMKRALMSVIPLPSTPHNLPSTCTTWPPRDPVVWPKVNFQ